MSDVATHTKKEENNSWVMTSGKREKNDAAFSFSFKILCCFVGNAAELMGIEILIINANSLCLNKAELGQFSSSYLVRVSCNAK